MDRAAQQSVQAIGLRTTRRPATRFPIPFLGGSAAFVGQAEVRRRPRRSARTRSASASRRSACSATCRSIRKWKRITPNWRTRSMRRASSASIWSIARPRAHPRCRNRSKIPSAKSSKACLRQSCTPVRGCPESGQRLPPCVREPEPHARRSSFDIKHAYASQSQDSVAAPVRC